LIGLRPVMGQSTEKVDKLFAEWDRRDSPGCVLGVVRHGKLVYQRGYGMADLDQGVAISPDTVFNIASVSKQFTAFLIMLLAQAGLLSLDDDVRRHVPELPDFGKTITLRHLLNHTSGLREDWSLLSLSGRRSGDVLYKKDAFDLVLRQKDLNFSPGAEYLYCNTGYYLLALVAERVGGDPLRVAARKRIFEPLGMNRSVFQDDPRMVIAGRATSYEPGKDGSFERIPYAAGRAGPGNLHTTIGELALWDQNFYEPRVGDAKLMRRMQEKGKLTSGKEIAYAAGLVRGDYRTLPIVEHTGSIAGYRSVLLRFPEQRLSVIILANLGTISPAVLARKVADIYLATELVGKPADTPMARQKPPKIVRPVLSAEKLAEFAGRFYSDELDILHTAFVRDGKLILRHPRDVTILSPSALDAFTAPSESVFSTIRFTRGDDKKVNGFLISTPRARNLRFQKVTLQPG
jgi:CubicO group peptidase (beta-lactamase class C family)